KEILAYEAIFDWIAACHLLEFSFGPSFSFFGFDCGDEACAAQGCEIGWVAFAVGDDEQLHVCGFVVMVDDTCDGTHEDGFAVPAFAVAEEEGIFLSASGEAVAAHALQEVLQFFVCVGDAVEEREPELAAIARRLIAWCYGGDLGDVVCRLWGREFTGV